ncbi:oligosaccharide flippase family protein [Patescibacteria group bacterium]|nr:oligosaccharide flippase family protein [Patescibacteria group bacterium]
MKDRLLSYYKNDFLRHNVIFFIGSMTVAVLNYVYHPIVSRLLSVEEFGELQAYFSLIVQIGVISGVFGRIILNIKTNISDTDDGQIVVSHLYSLSTIVTALIAATLIIFSPYIGAFFNLPGTIGLLLTGAILIISIPLTFAKFELQAMFLRRPGLRDFEVDACHILI